MSAINIGSAWSVDGEQKNFNGS